MAQNTNLNVSPYFDDFDENKNYKKVLFKPGFPIQSRELNTLQSILQNQTEKFGQYFFKEGSVVIPGATFYDDRYFAVRIDPYFLNIPVKEYTSILSSEEIEIKGETSGVTATVVNRITDTESIDGFDTLYVKYKSAGIDPNVKTFIDGENLITLSDIDYSLTKISANSSFAKCINSNATKIGSSASINEGIYFIRGYFIKVQKETIVLDQYSNTPSYRIGLLINEEIISASSENPDLFDNAQGFPNESAPGADRFKISVSLYKKELTDLNDQNFIELIRVDQGTLQKFVNKTELNIFKEELARRTFEESGDYYISPFAIDVRESLNDRISNRGVYYENQLTQNGNTPSDDIFVLQVSPGKAYIRGYDIDKLSTSSIDSVKPRTIKSKQNVSLPIKIGNLVKTNNVYGSPKIGFSTTYTISLLDQRLNGNRTIGSASTIGIARVYDFNQRFVSGVSTTQYDLRLFDIQTYTSVTIGFGITASADSHIKGQYSGATGFLKNSISNGTTLTIYDTKGNFTINEPIIVNGINAGRNLTSIIDYNFTDVKSVYGAVGVSTFASDLLLDQKAKVFTETSQFTITPGTTGFSTVTSPSVSDFRSSVKVGDVVQYSRPGFSTITYNRVSTVSATSLTLVGVSTVTGVCEGALPPAGSNLTVTDFDVVIPTLENASDPGYTINLQNRYVASINLLDSTYIVRKQISKNITGSTYTFYLSDLGDNNIYFEPFKEDNYILTWETGQKEVLTSAQVSFSVNLREITFSGLSRTGNATLSCTVKRTSLSSKEKTLVRCNELIVNRSKYSGSGIGSTTFNDGLTYSSVYGTRVQDDEISLNYPDIYRILGIFESNDSSNPTLPALTVSSQSDSFVNNVKTGEQLIGNSSGSLARVVYVDGSNQIRFVYENEKTFEIGETITFKTSSIIATISILIVGDRNIVRNYEFDDGYRLEYADYGRIIRTSRNTEPTKKLSIIFDYYQNNEASGTVESVNSYNSLNYSKEIPSVLGVRASDYIDLRPKVSSYSTSSTLSPFSFSSRNFSGSSSESIVSNETIVVDYSYYLGRLDRLYLTKDGLFEIKKGEPSETPKLPVPNNEGFEVATISMNPYMINATNDCSIKTIPHKRYTMNDIGSLETRIKTLEDYTTLSLLETDTKNLSIKDPNTGLDKFKSGFFVDTFRNHESHNLTGDSKFDIDIENGECRPRSTERNVSLIFETKSSLSNSTNSDYRWIEDFESDNITRNGVGLTLKYTEVPFIVQNLASRTENINPFHIALYAGAIELTPISDFWIEEVMLETPDVIKIDSAFGAVAELLGVEDRENGGMSASYWNSHETTWTGKEVIREELLNSDVISSSSVVDAQRRNQVPLRRNVTTTTTTTSNDYLQTIKQTGVDKTFGLQLTAGEERISLGNRVVGVDVLYNCRSRNIEVVGNKLKPNTRYYVFFENTDVTEYCTPKLLPITMTRGSFATSDIVRTSVATQSIGNPQIKFRVAQLNHKFGDFKSPTVTYSADPYTLSPLGSSYSSTSALVNLDTGDLALLVDTSRSGWVRKGSVIANESGTAEAVVNELSLKSDEKGTLIFSLFIPDPKIASNPKFTTGQNTIRITTSPTNANNLDPGESSAQTTYFATGYAQNTQEQTLSIKTPEIERKQIGSDQPITQITQNLDENRIETRTNVSDTGWYDPLAQSFLIERDKYQDGVFVTGGEVYFKTKDEVSPVTIQIRTMRDGSPTGVIVPFGETQVDPKDIPLSVDGSAPTTFKFSTPVYLQSGYEYALVLVSPTSKYLTFTSRVGDEDLILGSISNKQPYMGSLFKSQNGSTWDASQFEDLKFKLFKAKFVTNTPSSFIFYNSDLPKGKILKENPATSYSKRQYVSIANTTIAFSQGNSLTQTSSYGNVFDYGGPVGLGTTSLVVSSTGIGLTNGTFTGIGFSAITGYGSSCVATVTVSGGSVTNLNVTSGGNGYRVGDLILANQLGNTGTGVRATVGIVTNTNLLVVDDVSGSFDTSNPLTYYNSTGSSSGIAVPTSVNSDPIRDGYTLLFDHRNHGMHSSSNKLEVINFNSDISPTILSSSISDTSTTITVSNAGILTSFEGSAIGVANTGYLLIDNEIISYNSISGNDITITGRAIDNSLKTTHVANSLVYTYQFNSVSLRKINNTHNIDPREKTFDSYYLKLTDTSKSFKTTKSGGGKNLEVSQNIPFEVISPRVNSITPSGTNITTRIKTTSGTSISGNEASFTDQGYENVSLNKLNYLNSPRIVASKVNEYNLLSNQKSFALEMTLSTTKEDVSPFIDLNTANIITISNLVDDKVDNFETDSRCKIPGNDPNSGIYETKKISLEFPSNSLYVQFDGHKFAGADIRVMYKLYRNDNSDFQQIYTPFNTDGSPDKTVNPNNNLNQFSEYKFTAENLPQFNGFMIKVIMTSNDQSKPPRIKNFRSIALRSYAAE
jgi:hypothetical protein